MPRVKPRPPIVAGLLAGRALGATGLIVDEIRQCILDGSARPGTSIPLAEVASFFGVSHIPVRESLTTLVAEGLVEHRPGGGYRVAPVTIEEQRELELARHALEVVAMRSAVTLATEADDAAVVAAHQAIDENDSFGYGLMGERFHFALCSPCHMQRLLHLLKSLRNGIAPFQPMSRISAEDRAVLQTDHRAMVDAFLARDSEALLRVAEIHHGRLLAAVDSTTVGDGGRW